MDNIAQSLSDTIENAPLEKLHKEMGNLLIDDLGILTGDAIKALTKNELLKEIPIIRTFLIIFKGIQSFSNYSLMKKIYKCMYQLQDVPLSERRNFIKKMERKGKRRQIVENLLLVLNKHENYKKSEIQGKLLAALILEKITQEEYSKMTYATNLINVDSIKDLLGFYSSTYYASPLSAEQLYNFGFLQLLLIDNSKIGTWGGGGPTYEKNLLGQKYVNIILELRKAPTNDNL